MLCCVVVVTRGRTLPQRRSPNRPAAGVATHIPTGATCTRCCVVYSRGSLVGSSPSSGSSASAGPAHPSATFGFESRWQRGERGERGGQLAEPQQQPRGQPAPPPRLPVPAPPAPPRLQTGGAVRAELGPRQPRAQPQHVRVRLGPPPPTPQVVSSAKFVIFISFTLALAIGCQDLASSPYYHQYKGLNKDLDILYGRIEDPIKGNDDFAIMAFTPRSGLYPQRKYIQVERDEDAEGEICCVNLLVNCASPTKRQWYGSLKEEPLITLERSYNVQDYHLCLLIQRHIEDRWKAAVLND
ncbi:unnamed protein product [Arctia plantaginis]|uniref:Uncharacterized protein n=1 Tax=Arctia plantaginis TaxID=874455 RepID=A0A8S1AHF5_ARCPL|nr:unnamed protein product [Arctia plantaginis]